MIKNTGHRKLSRTGSHRRAMFSNMASSLLVHEKITTTLPKAKELRRVVEHVITDAKNGKGMLVRKALRGSSACEKTIKVLAERYKDRPGGFTRILKLGARKGDGAEVAMVKLAE